MKILVIVVMHSLSFFMYYYSVEMDQVFKKQQLLRFNLKLWRMAWLLLGNHLFASAQLSLLPVLSEMFYHIE